MAGETYIDFEKFEDEVFDNSALGDDKAGLFSHYDTDSKTKKKLNDNSDYVLKLRTQKQITKRVSEISNLISLPKPDEQYRIVTTRSFDAISFLTFISDKEEILECYITVYSIGKRACSIIDDLLTARKLGECTFLISNIRNTSVKDKDNFVRTIYEKHKDKFRLIYAFSHTKTIHAKTKNGNFYNIEGSGNFNNNARIEQYLFDNNETAYNFHKGWINDVKKFSANKDVVSYERKRIKNG